MNPIELYTMLLEIANRQAYRKSSFHTFIPVLDSIVNRLAGPLKVVEWGPGKNTELFVENDKVSQVVSYENDKKWFETYHGQFAKYSNTLDLKLIPFEVQKPVTREIVRDNYDPLHPYVRDPFEHFGENYFDIAFVDGGGYRTDCAEMAQMLVKDGGFIVWHDILSYRENNREFPSGRTFQEVFTNFPEYHYYDKHRTLLIVNRKSSKPYKGNSLTEAKSQMLTAIFDTFISQQIRYVVLRNAEDMPLRCTLNNDIDILIHPEDYSNVHSLLIKHGFEHKRDQAQYGSMLYGAAPHDHYMIKHLELHIDIVKGLYYRSPNNGEKVAITRALQKSIFERRQFTSDIWGYVPHPNDLFLHIFCHALFDKDAISNKYVVLLEELLGLTEQELLVKELEAVVFKFAPIALQAIRNRQTLKLSELYFSYSDY